MTLTRIGFSTPKTFNPVSRLVRLGTGSRCSHTWFLYFDTDWEMEMVLEAHEFGFRLLPFARFQERNTVVAVVAPKVDIEAGLRWVALWLGTRYDYGGLFGMAWVILGRILKRRWANPWESSRAMFCSEMAMAALQRCAYPGLPSVEPSSVSPQDLLNYLAPAHPAAG